MTTNRRRPARLAGALALAAAALAMGTAGLARAAPVPEESWGLPRDVSVDGWRTDHLIISTTIFISIMFVITVIWIFYSVFKHGPGHEAHYTHGSAKKSVVTALVLSAVIFFVVDGNLFINGMQDIGQGFWNWDIPNNDPKTVRIQVNAHQWAWDARYAGPDGKFNTADDVVTLNDIRVPVDTPVFLQIASTDVIHSFYLPNFRVKQDAMPGMVNRMWFQAKQQGEFDIACAQHCGVHHYKMKGQLTVLPDAEFKTWLEQASAISSRAYDAADSTSHWGWDWDKRNRS